MKYRPPIGIILLVLIGTCACAPPPIKLTDEQIAALALSSQDLPLDYAVDSAHTGLVTYDTLIAEGGVETAAYVKSVEGIHIYRTAFERISSATGPLVIWSWVIVYQDETDAHGYFAAHTGLYPGAQPASTAFPRLGQESIADYTTATIRGFRSNLRHIIFRQNNIVIYVAPLYAAAEPEQEDDALQYAQLLETRLLALIRDLQATGSD